LREEGRLTEEQRLADEAAKRAAEIAAERAQEAAEREAADKEAARRDWPYDQASFEKTWLQLKVRLAAETMAAERRRREAAANPRAYLNGLPGYTGPQTKGFWTRLFGG
jgi:hypothetical protein